MNVARNSRFRRTRGSFRELLEAAYSKSGKRTTKSIQSISLRSLSWGPEHTKGFNSLQDTLRKATTLSHVDHDKQICTFTDASNYFYAAAVTQCCPEELNKPYNEHRHEPLAFISAAFRGPQIRWSTYEKEAYVIFQVFTKLGYMLETANPPHVSTDHRNLLFIFNPLAIGPVLGRHIVSKVQRWALYLSKFQYNIEHIEGE